MQVLVFDSFLYCENICSSPWGQINAWWNISIPAIFVQIQGAGKPPLLLVQGAECKHRFCWLIRMNKGYVFRSGWHLHFQRWFCAMLQHVCILQTCNSRHKMTYYISWKIHFRSAPKMILSRNGGGCPLCNCSMDHFAGSPVHKHGWGTEGCSHPMQLSSVVKHCKPASEDFGHPAITPPRNLQAQYKR